MKMVEVWIGWCALRGQGLAMPQISSCQSEEENENAFFLCHSTVIILSHFSIQFIVTLAVKNCLPTISRIPAKCVPGCQYDTHCSTGQICYDSHCVPSVCPRHIDTVLPHTKFTNCDSRLQGTLCKASCKNGYHNKV